MKESSIYDLLVERDGEICGICKGSVTEELAQFQEFRKFQKEIHREKRRLQRLVMDKRKELGIDIDHIIPRIKNGSNDIENKQISHIKCNAKKGDNLTPSQETNI